MKISVCFAEIDARDHGICGYDPVAFCELKQSTRNPAGLEYESGLDGLNANNGKLQLLLIQEYLTRLAKLQDELRQKYTPLFDQTDDGKRPMSVMYYVKGIVDKQDYDAAMAEAVARFPGPKAGYYT